MVFLTGTGFKVGALVLVVLGLVGVMTLNVSDDIGLLRRTKTYTFDVADAGGLVKNSAVRMAGIKVGRIKSILLHEGQARVEIELESDVPVTRSATVAVKSSGILGDRYVELRQGGAEDQPLESGSSLGKPVDSASLDELVGRVGKLADSLSTVADGLRDATVTGNRDTPIGRIVSNIETLTGDLADVAKSRKDRLGETIDNLHAVSEELNTILGDESEDSFKTQLRKAMAGLARFDKTMKNVEEISEKINKGEGTIGKLVNDEKTVEEVNTAVTNINNIFGQINRISTGIDFRTEHLSQFGLYKSYLGLKIKPGLDRYYEFQVVDDPRGVVDRQTTETTTNPGGPNQTTNTVAERRIFQNRVKFSATFAKNFYDFTVRGGLIESAGGVGFDYYLFRRKLRLTFDAFDFAQNSAHLRTFARYDVFKGLYLIGGWDDFASKVGLSSPYIGAGIDITNDDLKALLTRINF